MEVQDRFAYINFMTYFTSKIQICKNLYIKRERQQNGQDINPSYKYGTNCIS